MTERQHRQHWGTSRLFDRGTDHWGPSLILEKDFDDVHGQLTSEQLDHVYADSRYSLERHFLKG